jgi:hypothetical protein
MAADIGPDQVFDNVEELIRGPQLGHARPNLLLVVDQRRRARPFFFERCDARVEVFARVLVLDLAGAIELVGVLIDYLGNFVYRQLQFPAREKVLDDQESIVKKLLDLPLVELHRGLPVDQCARRWTRTRGKSNAAPRPSRGGGCRRDGRRRRRS